MTASAGQVAPSATGSVFIRRAVALDAGVGGTGDVLRLCCLYMAAAPVRGAGGGFYSGGFVGY